MCILYYKYDKYISKIQYVKKTDEKPKKKPLKPFLSTGESDQTPAKEDQG